jgi:hypothetical protein
MINTLRIASNGYIGFSLNKLLTIASIGLLASTVSNGQSTFLGNSTITCKIHSSSGFFLDSSLFGNDKFISNFTDKVTLISMSNFIVNSNPSINRIVHESSSISCKIGYSSQITTKIDFKNEIK